MESHPSQSGRFSAEEAYSHSPGSSDNILGRTSSSSLSDASSQSLASILNNPHVGRSGVYGSDGSWAGWWYSSSSTVHPPEFLPLPNRSLNEVNRSDFQQYLGSISEPCSRFEDIRVHTSKEYSDLENVGCQGQALVSCLREVPSLYFKEDFALEDGPTFLAACPFSVMSENVMLQEKLSQYLDVIEMHLVKEISLRSNSFFEAQGQLEDLNVKIVEGCNRIRDLKETIRLLDVDLVDSARQVQELNATRSNLLGLQQKLRLILYVNQALSALKLLVASADCAGALDVIDDMRHLLDGDGLAGLHCFRHLRDHVATSIDSVNSILSAEFLHCALHDAGNIDRIILSKAKAKSKERVSILEYVNDGEVFSDKDEISNFQERLFPAIIGLLRVGKLPTVLRIYRDRLTVDMKTAIKTAVAELLPVLVAQCHDSVFSTGEGTSDADGGGLSLASKLRSLSSESFVHLLSAIFMIVQTHLARAGDIKKAIEWIMSNLDGHYAANSVASAIALGATVSEASQKIDGESLMLLYPHQINPSQLPCFKAKENIAISPSNMSRNFRADVLRENTEAVFASCDAAHGRWAKLLGVRALLHPKLRLQEFLSIYCITEKFIAATEKIGGRLGYSIRGTLQSQAKAFVYCQHESRMAKLKAVLDQETWAEVDVPDEFQSIITSMLCSGFDATENLNTKNYVSSVMPSNDDGPVTSVAELSNFRGPGEHCAPLEVLASEKSKMDVIISSTQNNINITKERDKTTTQILSYKGVSYHMVNCGLILLKMLSEYIDMNKSLPSLSSEVVHRVTEILKFFNTRTCQLVLGAGALQVAGLRSITSKHLALASQVISFIFAIIPDIQLILFIKVPESRKPLLLHEIDRVAQDYMVHRDEIHSKLVQIMRERLLFHLRGLPQIVEKWNRLEDNDSQPSQFARSLTKEVAFLQRVLSRILHEVDVHEIFRQVVIIFHSQISDAFSHLEITTPHAKNNLYRDAQHILGCIRLLPSHDLKNSEVPNTGQLDELLLQRFSSESVQQITV